MCANFRKKRTKTVGVTICKTFDDRQTDRQTYRHTSVTNTISSASCSAAKHVEKKTIQRDAGWTQPCPTAD